MRWIQLRWQLLENQYLFTIIAERLLIISTPCDKCQPRSFAGRCRCLSQVSNEWSPLICFWKTLSLTVPAMHKLRAHALACGICRTAAAATTVSEVQRLVWWRIKQRIYRPNRHLTVTCYGSDVGRQYAGDNTRAMSLICSTFLDTINLLQFTSLFVFISSRYHIIFSFFSHLILVLWSKC